MTDHHDFSFDDDHSFDHAPPPDDHLAWDDAGLSHDLSHDFDPPDADVSHPDVSHLDAPHLSPSEGDPADSPDSSVDDASLMPAPHSLSDISDLPGEEVFPPPVDVGELPEPVDGFPWIDSGSLGLADIAAALHDQEHIDPVRPEELAEYAATDLPPGVDPWATLADSDDPATAALAKWWQQN
ncbi:hypothetical protein ACIA5D_18750 [Actinoplanes sp. NPDC051513]|uniref:hypothetical protein n=1 Tax=Actinoplanes sp. NPDC051513 TaxID=3363908 RepID=UPI00378E5834